MKEQFIFLILSLFYISGFSQIEFLDSNLMATNCYYRQVGAWVSGFSYPITKGSISGRKISENEWDVQVNVYTTPRQANEASINIDISGAFLIMEK